MAPGFVELHVWLLFCKMWWMRQYGAIPEMLYPKNWWFTVQNNDSFTKGCGYAHLWSYLARHHRWWLRTNQLPTSVTICSQGHSRHQWAEFFLRSSSPQLYFGYHSPIDRRIHTALILSSLVVGPYYDLPLNIYPHVLILHLICTRTQTCAYTSFFYTITMYIHK